MEHLQASIGKQLLRCIIKFYEGIQMPHADAYCITLLGWFEFRDSLHGCGNRPRKWVAETEQQTLNRSILSTSLREKELQKDLWLMEARGK